MADHDRRVRDVILFTCLLRGPVGAYSYADSCDRADGRGRSRLGHHARVGMECCETCRHLLQPQFSRRISHGNLDDSGERRHLWLSTDPGLFTTVDVARPVVAWVCHGIGHAVLGGVVHPVSRGHDRMSGRDGLCADSPVRLEISRQLRGSRSVARALCPHADP